MINILKHIKRKSEKENKNNIWLDGMMGLVVGDALGMPVQFVDRQELKNCPVETMEGYGTYDMPPGTWSDDSSMALATLSSIREKNAIDCDDIMERFMDWNLRGEYTPAGVAFDQGRTCMEAIFNYARNKDYITCGKTGEYANGNGALMRIMPVCLYAYNKVSKNEWADEDAVESVHLVSSLTHNHMRSKMACGIYYFMIKGILDNEGALLSRLQVGIDEAKRYYQADITNYVEFAHYGRLLDLDRFSQCNENDIKSSGYVVDSLEAAVWSLIVTDGFEDALLTAVNLGDDTDTVGAIAGGLAGLFYGYAKMPKDWLQTIVKREWLEESVRRMKSCG